MRQDSGIGVLDKAVGVLHAVAQSPCGLADLCERTDLPRATAHRLAVGLDGLGQAPLGEAQAPLAALGQGRLGVVGQAVGRVEPVLER
ncbi:MAG: helix-turn-helix domain-containing protein, partial [Mycobacterium sp.]